MATISDPAPAQEGGSNIARRRKSALVDGGADYHARREEIVNVAGTLFREKGFKSTTLADIGRRAGLDRATLYYYFASKEEVFRESIKGVLDKNLAEADQLVDRDDLTARAKVQIIARTLMESYENNYPHMYVYIQELMHEVSKDPTPWGQAVMLQTRQLEATVRTLLKQGVASGEFRNDLPVTVMANALFGMINWTHRWFRPSGPLRAEHLAHTFCGIFFDGVRGETAKPRSRVKAGRGP